MTRTEWKVLTDSMKKLKEFPIFIDDNPNVTISDIRAKSKTIFTTEKKTGIIIIDYLQLMKMNLKYENRAQEISHITRNLKILAKELQIPIILLSQLSRNVESRVNKRPMLSDLRESGCISKQNFKFQKSILSWNQNCFYNLKQSSNEFFKGIKPTYLIILEINNRKVLLTANHKILGKNSWIPIFEFIRKNKISFFENSADWNKKLNYFSLKNIEYMRLNKVYDKTIPIFHNYFNQNILFHNSIEQDADIVIMLYREEYYNEKITNQQITEFIVAKHRNGPIGTAKLLFNSATTTFQNNYSN
jgi:replicative DNA helicase